MKIRHGLAITASGILWLLIGLFLLFKGFSILLHTFEGADPICIPYLLAKTSSTEQASLLIISAGLLVGFIKGKIVLAKTANRIIQKILSQPNPCPITCIYPPSYLILLSTMMLMGISLKYFLIPYDLKGFIDVAVGSALANGSAFYFRHFAKKGAKT